MKKVLALLMGLLILLLAPAPNTNAETASDRFHYPSSCQEGIDSRYVPVEVDKLDACLYAFLNTECEVEYRLLVTEKSDGHTHLIKATVQKAIIYDEDQPDILVTVYPDAGEPSFCTELDDTLAKQVVDGTLVLETEVGSIEFDVSELIADATPTSAATPAPGTSMKPTSTPKPSNSSKPTSTPKPTATATPYHWKCKECGKDFGEDYDAWYYHAWINPGHYNETPAPTQNPGGHWETVWVVDVPEQGHGEYVCNVCGKHFDGRTQEAEFLADQHAHMDEDPPRSGWHTEHVVDVPEQGHWETIWVPDP